MSLQAVVVATFGGVLIGVGAALLLVCVGRPAGISGIVGGLFRGAAGDWAWRAAFVVGLLTGGAAFAAMRPAVFGVGGRSLLLLGVAGLAVGLGSRLGGGCTSGHGVCGISRLSRRSLAATFTFMLVGAVTVLSVRAAGVPR